MPLFARRKQSKREGTAAGSGRLPDASFSSTFTRNRNFQPMVQAAPTAYDSIISPRSAVAPSEDDPSQHRSDADSGDDSDDSNKTVEILRDPRTGRASDKRDTMLEDLFRGLLNPQTMPSFPTGVSDSGPSRKGNHSKDEDLKDGLFSHLSKLQTMLSEAENEMPRYKQDKWSVLHLCAQGGKLAQIKALLNRGADIEIMEDNDWTPIMLAAQNGHTEVVQEFISRGANVNHTGNDGVTSLRQAAQNNHVEIVELLLSVGANPNQCTISGTGPLNAAVYGAGRLSTEKKQRFHQIVRALIRHGANIDLVDGDGDTPLHVASIIGEMECVKMLVTAGAKLNVLNNSGRSPLSHAAYESNIEMVKYLLEHGAEVDQRDDNDRWTPLHFTSQFLTPRTFDTIRMLIENGADVNSRTNSNATALHLAAQRGDLSIIKYLLQQGAAVDAKTDTGRSPLFQAVANGQIEAVRTLVDAGANVNFVATKNLKLGPLHIAVLSGNINMVSTLLSLGADPNLPTGDRTSVQTPLSFAASTNNSEEIFMLLLDHGANPQ